MDKKKTEENIRPPIVTLMGHVDHGKTTLLDAIRASNIVAREHGGITQHIGAYQIKFQNNLITFIDTPGHAAFEKMRSRGADVADIVILVVAAGDGVKPQTVEAIKAIKSAQKPIIVAITKVDLPDINVEKVKGELQKEGIIPEGYGGDVPVCEVAAPLKKGVRELLEMINLIWQLAPEKNLATDPLEAVVIESYLDKKRGSIVNIVVKKGTIKVTQKIQVDDQIISVRSLIDDRGQAVKEAGPSKPVEVLGFKNVLEVGSQVRDLISTKTYVEAKAASLSEIIAKSQEIRNKFKVIIKADVAGSLEAILANLPHKIIVVYASLGDIDPSDVANAKVAQAPILAFNVKISPQIKAIVERENVIIRPYQVIYELLEDLDAVVESYEQVKHEQKITGRAKIVAIFNIEDKKIAGVKVIEGKIKVGDQILIKSSGGKGSESKIISLKKFKKEINTASAGQECGVGLESELDFQEGDIIESVS